MDLFNIADTIKGATYHVDQIDAKEARDIVKKYHYSGKVVANSNIHLGVFRNDTGELVGALQYGPCMNGEKTSSKISETHKNMAELNRMVMNDVEPRNAESQAISLCNKWLKRNTELDYILSFSDGKEGNCGYIYQATNWKYIGFMLSNSFYRLDGGFMHSVTVWHKYKEKHPLRETHTTDEVLCTEFENVEKVWCKQHVYVMPLRRKVKFLHDDQPYPKLETETAILKSRVLKLDGVVSEKPKDVVYCDVKMRDIFGKPYNP